ncbi:hypothetical protein [Solemya velesiana gill symbiont]|uniref:Uncharacterized protein n=1 Tax=Solemya velesiana gill symbiont TaxID=1918948 RepID=A0A1T2KXW9_9GAMM|nr:hypothetical protein [Solemya velesiana gill symbiont]OOZ37699.1 hypothetical protein BOW51_00755 [Solemya velesiana gill symbiont]
MDMEPQEFIKELSRLYLKRDVSGTINTINEYKNKPGFQRIYRKLLNARRIKPSVTSLHGVTKALLTEISLANTINRGKHSDENFFEIGDRLKQRYNFPLAESTWRHIFRAILSSM